MRHVMIDLETWGTRPGCALRSLGAVAFDMPGEGSGDTAEFYANISRDSCEKLGMIVEEGTVQWWAQQSRQAQDALDADQKTVGQVTADFLSFWRTTGATHIWSHGASFDVVLIEEALRLVDRQKPWKFWNIRDTRTIFECARLNTKSIKFEGDPHNALHDARHQARLVQEAYQRIRREMLL